MPAGYVEDVLALGVELNSFLLSRYGNFANPASVMRSSRGVFFSPLLCQPFDLSLFSFVLSSFQAVRLGTAGFLVFFIHLILLHHNLGWWLNNLLWSYYRRGVDW